VTVNGPMVFVGNKATINRGTVSIPTFQYRYISASNAGNRFFFFLLSEAGGAVPGGHAETQLRSPLLPHCLSNKCCLVARTVLSLI
jgi:hypothetical protein